MTDRRIVREGILDAMYLEETDGGPAFPLPVLKFDSAEEAANWRKLSFWGMSLRDYFAGLALPALANDDRLEIKPGETWAMAIARNAYELAEAMVYIRRQSFLSRKESST